MRLDQLRESYTYADISIIPTEVSKIPSRSHCDTGTNFLDRRLGVPIIAAPMKSVCKADMAIKLWENGAFGILCRTSEGAKDLEEYRLTRALGADAGVAIGIKGDYIERFREFRKLGAKVFCLDTANGFHADVVEALKELKRACDHEWETKFITGNVGSIEGFNWLAGGSHAIRVGIGNGSLCTTSIATGIGQGQASLVNDIVQFKRYPFVNNAQIIADGGIREPGDICKAIALGADVVMVGSLLAGTDEAPGELVYKDGQKFKRYYGEASKTSKGSSKFVEGTETLVPCKGPVSEIIQQIRDGLQSSMAYNNCLNLEEFRKLGNNPDRWRRLSHNSRFERTAHGKT